MIWLICIVRLGEIACACLLAVNGSGIGVWSIHDWAMIGFATVLFRLPVTCHEKIPLQTCKRLERVNKVWPRLEAIVKFHCKVTSDIKWHCKATCLALHDRSHAKCLLLRQSNAVAGQEETTVPGRRRLLSNWNTSHRLKKRCSSNLQFSCHKQCEAAQPQTIFTLAPLDGATQAEILGSLWTVGWTCTSFKQPESPERQRQIDQIIYICWALSISL